MESWLSRYDAAGIRAVDRWAIEDQAIAEAELMEAAGSALAEAVAGLAPQGPVRIVCGKGNNGGDGLVCGSAPGRDGLRGGDRSSLTGGFRRTSMGGWRARPR